MAALTDKQELALFDELEKGVSEKRKREILEKLPPIQQEPPAEEITTDLPPFGDVNPTEEITTVAEDAKQAVADFVSVGTSFGSGVNKFIAETSGIPVSLINTAVEFVTPFVRKAERATLKAINPNVKLPPSLREDATLDIDVIPFGIKQQVKAGTELGFITPPEKLDTPAKRIASRTAEELSTGIIPTGIFLRAGRALQMAPQFVKTLAPKVLTKPAQFVASEAATAVAGGVGAGLALEAFPGSQVADIVGSIGGSLTPTAAEIGKRGFDARKAGQFGVPQKTEQAVAELVQAVSGQPVKDVQALRTPQIKGTQQTPGKITDNPGLLELEASVIRTDASLTNDFEEAATITKQVLEENARGILEGKTSKEAVQKFFVDRVNKAIGLINKSVTNATRLAQQKIDDFGPTATRPFASTVVEQELEVALEAARKTQAQIWKQVDPAIRFGTSLIKAARKNILESAKRKKSKVGLPKKILQRVKKLSGDETTEVLQTLRSDILQAKRVENGKLAPNRKTLGMLDDIQASILEAMEATAEQVKRGDSIQGENIAKALEFTRALHNTFTRGPVGKVLKFDSLGGKRLPDELTLKTLFQQGEIGGVNADALLNAAGGSKKLQSATRSFLFQAFMDQASPSGKIRPQSMQKFLDNHKDLLERFPEVRQELSDITTAQSALDSRIKSGEIQVKNLQDSQKSVAALFLNVEDPSKAIGKALNSKNPVESMKQLVLQAGTDASGDALEGLKSATSEFIIDKALVEGIRREGQTQLAAIAIRKTLKSNRKALGQLYTPDELKRLDTITDALATSERTAKGATAEIAVKKKGFIKNFLVGALGRIAGHAIGPTVGLPSLVSVGLGRTAALKIFQETSDKELRTLVIRAVRDPEIMETLLMRPDSPGLEKRLRGHLLNIGATVSKPEEANQPEE